MQIQCRADSPLPAGGGDRTAPRSVMAVIIPERVPSRATQGERLLFQRLKECFPDDYFVYYEADVQRRYPDFTVVGGTFGLLVLEVKGWYAGQITRVSDDEVELEVTRDGQTRVEKHPNPYRQAREYMFRVIDLLRAESSLCVAGGRHQGRLCFPGGCAAVFTNITRDQLERAGLALIFPPDKAICRDELEEWHPGSAVVLWQLRRYFSADFRFDPLTSRQIDSVRGILHPEIVLRPPAGRLPELSAGSVPLKVLDVHQEQTARSVGDGHRILAGVAGSGKTVVLLARARLLAERQPEKRILVLCYNRALAAYLRAQIGSSTGPSQLQVETFHGWA